MISTLEKPAPTDARTSLVRRWEMGLPAFGISVTLPDPFVAEILAGAQLDFFLLDCEHSPLTADQVQTLLIALRHSSGTTLVRVAGQESGQIMQALDLGADGVVVPHVESAEQAAAAVAAAHYPPRGHRGIGPRRASRISELAHYLAQANNHTVVVVMIESGSGVAELHEILRVDGVSAVLVGLADLAASLGHIGEPTHPDVEAVVFDIARHCKSAGVPYGMNAGSPARARALLTSGARMITLGSDVMLLEAGMGQVITGMAPLRAGVAAELAHTPEPNNGG